MYAKMKRLFKVSGALATLGLMVMGSYNTFQVNVDSFMLEDEIKFVKRLDELNGQTVSGRIVAHNGNWQTLAKEEKPVLKKVVKKVEKKEVVKAASTFKPEPAIVEELNLQLSQAFHPGKDLKGKKIQGNLQAYYGVIDAIDFNIEGVANVSLNKVGKLSGNVFEYSFGDEIYTAMLYEQNKTTYMVTLTTGPKELQGLRLQFKSDANIDLPNQEATEDSNVLAKDLNSTQEEYEKGGYQEENAQTENGEKTPTYGFNFSS